MLTKVLRISITRSIFHQSGIRIIFIPKLGRNDRIQPKDYRSISLTSFILKTLKKLIDRYLKNGPLLI